MVKLDKNVILSRSSNSDLESVFVLSLAKLMLHELSSVINSCTHLEVLDLSRNSLSTLSPLDGTALKKLHTLHAESNFLNDISAVAGCPSLKKLYLQGNRIRDLRDICALGPRLPSVTTLYLQDPDQSRTNPVCLVAKYRESVISAFPSLVVLDGEKIYRPKINDKFTSSSSSSPTPGETNITSLSTAVTDLLLAHPEPSLLAERSGSLEVKSKVHDLKQEIDVLKGTRPVSWADPYAPKVTRESVEVALSSAVSSVYEVLTESLQLDIAANDALRRVLGDEADMGSERMGSGPTVYQKGKATT